ncbi:hypothetical protein [Paraburkholderia strydomiana]|uniref:hypothetical protein n=1 Tax=Paraburkholderia strydomiana TaxID=1245417 RepID=UPI0038B72047
MKYSIVFVFILFSNCAFACGSGLQKAKMAHQLYAEKCGSLFVRAIHAWRMRSPIG